MTKNEGTIFNRRVLSHDSLLAASEQYAWCCDLDDEWWKTNSLSPHPSLWSAVFATHCWTREILRWGVGQVYEGNEAMFMSFESLTLAWVAFLESRDITVGSLVQFPSCILSGRNEVVSEHWKTCGIFEILKNLENSRDWSYHLRKFRHCSN